ncbi:MAG: tetratricopeptide repeat protein, partial [Planctomycetota bacterium]|nr:tetratricopeptide repeat protein [Planctomycetota bacterium]
MSNSDNLSVLFSDSGGVKVDDMSNPWQKRARILRNEGKFDLALQLFIKAHETDPDDASTLKEIAATLLRLDRTEEAVVLYNQFLKRQKENGPAWNDLGALYFEQQKHTD